MPGSVNIALCFLSDGAGGGWRLHPIYLPDKSGKSSSFIPAANAAAVNTVVSVAACDPLRGLVNCSPFAMDANKINGTWIRYNLESARKCLPRVPCRVQRRQTEWIQFKHFASIARAVDYLQIRGGVKWWWWCCRGVEKWCALFHVSAWHRGGKCVRRRRRDKQSRRLIKLIRGFIGARKSFSNWASVRGVWAHEIWPE